MGIQKIYDDLGMPLSRYLASTGEQLKIQKMKKEGSS
jgi:hypothetical protein